MTQKQMGAGMLRTERLTIRPLVADDWRSMQRIASDFSGSAYAVYDRPLPVEDAEIKSLTEQFAATQLFFAVLLQDTMIGYICFHDDGGIYDIGFCFHSDYHGKGYAYESCSAMMEYLEKAGTVSAFMAGTALKNTPSCSLLRKLGFVLKETEMLSFHTDEAGKAIAFEGGVYQREIHK